MWTNEDEGFMREALGLAEQGLYTTSPNPRVGCVLVSNGVVVGRGFHRRAGEAHAEVHALAEAGDRARGATAYVTLEPCCHHGRTGPCTQALVDAGVRAVVAATEDPNPLVAGQGLERLRAAGIEVRCGLLREDAIALNRGFFHRFRKGRPWVRAKTASSADGRIALPNGQSQWISDAECRADGHHFRAQSCAVLTGLGTFERDAPLLTVRAVQTTRPPARILLDPWLRADPDAPFFAHPGAWVAHWDGLPAAARAAQDRLLARGVRMLPVPSDPLTPDGRRLDLSALLSALAQAGMNEILLEAGPGLSSAFAQADLIDEWLIYWAPIFLGEGPGPLLAAQPPLERPADAPRWRLLDAQALGEGVRIRLLHPQTDTL
ncbi:MAG: Riboflavin biosynthesis protein RibD [Pseudomonadota bacterium]|jgi:diaminohydroxyphosphoribosylaminopyrimidine deaminase/5-amino-6-(5-phosphoribosylamino)uracil reductase